MSAVLLALGCEPLLASSNHLVAPPNYLTNARAEAGRIQPEGVRHLRRIQEEEPNSDFRKDVHDTRQRRVLVNGDDAALVHVGTRSASTIKHSCALGKQFDGAVWTKRPKEPCPTSIDFHEDFGLIWPNASHSGKAGGFL